MIKPITPKEALDIKLTRIPDEVIKIFNDLIIENLKNDRSTIQQEKVVDLISMTLGIPVKDIFKQSLLDIEKYYEKAGWDVVYDRPGYNEDYPATFKFSIKNKK